MADSPTILIAALDDKQLKDSISNLVVHMKSALNTMTKDTDDAVSRMQKSLEKLGSFKIDSGGSADGGSSRRAKKQQEETQATKENTQAHKELKMTLDQEASALRQTTQGNSARQSYLAFVKGFKAQGEEIAKQIQDAENALNRAVSNRVSELTSKLDNAKRKLNELFSQLSAEQLKAQQSGALGMPYNAGITRTQQAIEYTKKHIEELNKQIAEAPNMFGAQVQQIEQLRAKREQVLNIMREETKEAQQVANATKKQEQAYQQQASAINTAIHSEKKYTDEILKQAAAIRATKEWQETGHLHVGDVVYYDKERSNVSKRNKQLLLSLEEQIVQAQQNEAEAARRATQETQNQAQAQQQVQQSALCTVKIIESVYEMQRRSLGLSSGDASVPTFTLELESAKRLSDRLKELREQYNNMNSGQRTGSEGQAVAQQIREITRQVQNLNNQLNTPTKKEIAGLSEKTLDDIAYKIRQLNAYKQGLNLKTQGGEIKQVDAEIKRLNNDLNKYMNTSRQVSEINKALARSWNYMKNRLAFYFTVGASTSFVKNLIEVRSQYEMNERALGILINSAERGTQIFNELSQMALVSPYTLIELSSAAKQLVAYDIAAKDVVDTTRRLADISAAVGVPVERFTYALGQVKAFGHLTSQDARQFLNTGVPLVKELSKYYTELEGRLISTADVYERMKKHAVSYNDVVTVLNRMTDEGGKFFDFQAKMADTLKVRLANLTLAWNNMLNDIGKETQGLLTWGIGALRELLLHWKAIDSAIKDLALLVGVRTLIVAIRAATFGMGAFGKAMTWNAILGKRLGGIVVTLGRSLKSLAMTPLTWWTLLGLAAASAANEILFADKATKEFNQSLRESAKNTFGDLDKFIQQYKSFIDDLINNNGANIDKNEAKKGWEAIREQIELSLSSSDEYIGQLMRIGNVIERIKQGFDVLDDARAVSGALKEIGDDGITVAHKWSAWWNLWLASDGLIENIRDYNESVDDVIKRYGSLDSAQKKARESGSANVPELRIMNDQLNIFKGQLKETTDSILQFIQLKGWSADVGKINQIFSQVTQKLISENQLNPKEAFTLQMEMEEARSRAAKNALIIRLNGETEAYKNATSEWERIGIEAKLRELREEYNAFDENNGRGRVLWYDYTKWMKEQHISEMRAMFKDMNADEIAHIDFSKGEWNKWATETALKYAKEHGLAYADTFTLLHNWVLRANKWSIFIPLTIGEDEKKSVYDTLSEADTEIDTAYKKIQRLKTRQRELEAKGGYASSDIKVVEEYKRTLEEITAAQKDYNDALAKGGHSKKEDANNRKERKQAESELQKVIKEEVSLINKARSAFKGLKKDGVDSIKALTVATSGYEKSIRGINDILAKHGLMKLDLSKYVGIENPRPFLDLLNSQLSSGKLNRQEIETIEGVIRDLNIEVVSFDQKTLTDSLNSELGKLKDEYELAVEFDASPELGNVFMSAMGLNEEELRKLPRTWNDVANKAQQAINRVFDENGFGKSFDLLANLDKVGLEKWAEENGQNMDDALMKELAKFVAEVNKVRLDETKKTTKEWDDLIDKYGGLQHKLIKITKDSVQEQINVIKQSNDADAIKSALNLSDKISMSQDPSEIARLQNELAVIFSKVISDNPDLFKVGIGVENQELSLISESYWEDFKNSELYSEVFEDMSRKSVQSIRVIIAALDELKDKVKDDPESMKALIKSLDDATKELESRNPLKAIGDGFKKIKEGIQTVKFNRPLLENARKELDAANKSGDQERINKAQEDYNNALAKSRIGWDRIRAGQEKVVAGLEGMKNQVSMIGDAFTSVANLFGEFGDEDTKQAIEDINKGFTIMVSTITAVIAVMLILQASSVWLLAVAAALGVIIGLVNFLSKRDNRRIDKQIEQSEYRVKQLENAYKNLQHAMDEAYGTAVIGAKQMAIANKKLQLEELKRQLQLEKSRSKKDYDKEKVLELEGQIIDLENEINDAINDIVDNLLGVSSVGDAVGNLVDSIVDALRNGEDAMESFNESVDDMIVNLLKKFIMTRYIGPLVEEAFNKINDYINSKSQDSYDELELLKQERQKYVNLIKDAEKWRRNELFRDKADKVIADSKMQIANLDAKIAALNKLIQGSANLTESDLDVIFGIMEDLKVQASPYYDVIKEFLERYGMINDGNKELSALQQGLQSMSEDTANAIEAYLNGISQQVYLHSDLLTQIRDAVVSFDFDTNLGVMSQMLLQLQNNYILVQSMQSMMEGWTTPNGSGIRVELMS